MGATMPKIQRRSTLHLLPFRKHFSKHFPTATAEKIFFFPDWLTTFKTTGSLIRVTTDPNVGPRPRTPKRDAEKLPGVVNKLL